ncbi:MAG: hypothetical protein ACM31C_11275 [Acidobacteriota bacterium]
MSPPIAYYVLVVALLGAWTCIGYFGVLLMKGLLWAVSALRERPSPALPRAIARRRIGV